MRFLGAFVVAGLLFVTSLHGQTVRSHSSLRIPTPAIDDSEGRSPVREDAAVRSRSVPTREASLRQEPQSSFSDARSSSSDAIEASRPRLVLLDDAAPATTPNAGAGRTVSSTTLTLISSTAVGTGTQFYGPSAGPSSVVSPAVSPTGYATQANYAAASAPTVTYSQPTVVPSAYPPAVSTTTYSVPTSGIAQTSYSQPSYSVPSSGACCGGAGTSAVVTGMQPTFPTTTFPATTYPPASYPAPSYPATTVFAPPVSDAASYAPTLNGGTIPGAGYPAPGGASGMAVPYLINPVAVNIPAVPVDESRLQPVIALRPTVPEESYAGRGILGQPELYVRGQHVRNVLRYITLW